MLIYLPTQVFRNLTALAVTSHVPARGNKLPSNCIAERKKRKKKGKVFLPRPAR